MAPHMTTQELDRCLALRGTGKTPVEVHAALSRTRAARGAVGPDLTTVRRALRGVAHKRGLVETRGRRLKVTPAKLRALDSARKRLIQKAKGQSEVHMDDVMRAARVTNVTKGTVSRHFATLGVSWRTPRGEPLRDESDMMERVDMCQRWKRLPNDYFTDRVDAIIDNKVFPIPTYKRAKIHAKKSRVRGHLRRRSEGAPSSIPSWCRFWASSCPPRPLPYPTLSIAGLVSDRSAGCCSAIGGGTFCLSDPVS